jgi:putative membrane protein
MQFWCAASGAAWTWTWRAYPGVWLFIALLGVFVWRWNRAGARRHGATAPAIHPLFLLGLLVVWLALDWPIGALGAGYLASVHMLQFLLVALIAPPLLLRGPSRHALALLEGGRLSWVLQRLTSPLLALILFSTIVLLTHVPAIVDGLMISQLGSFAIDMLWLFAGLLFWWPVVVPVPAHRFPPPAKIGYLVFGMMFSPVMFGLVGFLVYSTTPLYGVFELAPPLPGVSSHADHQTAGALMSVGGAFVAFVAMSIIFFQWNKESA